MISVNRTVTAILRRPGCYGDMKTIDLVGEDGKTAYTLHVRELLVETNQGDFNQNQIENMGLLTRVMSNINRFVDRKAGEVF